MTPYHETKHGALYLGDALEVQRGLPASDGRIQPGEHRSPSTEFQPGTHWRPRKQHWDAAWLQEQYTDRQRSASDIAAECYVTENAILYWLGKHGIPRRNVSQARAAKHWGSTGSANGMYGATGPMNPHWKGGATPERQALYASAEWKAAARVVRKRDANACQKCGAVAGRRTPLHIHHITPFHAAPGLRTEVDNLVLVCKKCHSDLHRKAAPVD
jgi:hypothetical protein